MRAVKQTSKLHSVSIHNSRHFTYGWNISDTAQNTYPSINQYPQLDVQGNSIEAILLMKLPRLTSGVTR